MMNNMQLMKLYVGIHLNAGNNNISDSDHNLHVDPRFVNTDLYSLEVGWWYPAEGRGSATTTLPLESIGPCSRTLGQHEDCDQNQIYYECCVVHTIHVLWLFNVLILQLHIQCFNTFLDLVLAQQVCITTESFLHLFRSPFLHNRINLERPFGSVWIHG